jgi:hypothetical protein
MDDKLPWSGYWSNATVWLTEPTWRKRVTAKPFSDGTDLWMEWNRNRLVAEPSRTLPRSNPERGGRAGLILCQESQEIHCCGLFWTRLLVLANRKLFYRRKSSRRQYSEVTVKPLPDADWREEREHRRVDASLIWETADGEINRFITQMSPRLLMLETGFTYLCDYHQLDATARWIF